MKSIEMGPEIVGAIVGPLPMILRADYDPAQEWFAFMKGAILLPSPAPEKPEIIRRPSKSPFAWVAPEDRRLFRYEKEQKEQRVLPFSKRVGSKDFMRLKAAGFPGWDVDERGEPLMIALRRSLFSETDTEAVWREIEPAVKGRIHLRPRTYAAYLERLDDAVKVRLLFGE